jgi:hypothetical protein
MPVPYFTPVRPAEFSEVRKLPFTGSLPEALWREGILVRIDTSNGGVTPIYGTGGTRPTTNPMLSGIDTLFGVTVGSNQELTDPVLSSRIDYAGQTPTKRVSVAVCVPHRELIIQPIVASGSNAGAKDPTIAVPANIGKPVALYPQDYPITYGSTTYWLYAGAVLTTQANAEGYIVGITADKNLIVRIIRSKWIELSQ